MASRPTVSVIVPMRNEAEHIEDTLTAVLEQDFPRDRAEVIVVDGCSEDDSRRIVATVAGRLGWLVEEEASVGPALRAGTVLLLANPDRITPAALNRGLEVARGDVVVRVDGHCVVSPDYVRRCVAILEETGHACVGGRWEIVAETPVARAIAAAQASRFGVGNVAYRLQAATPQAVDTVPFGAYPRAVLTELGGFDEELVRNQDDELNFRLVQRGGTVWYDPSISSRYRSRSDLRRLWRQYFEYGSYKVRVAQKRGGLASWRHAAPATFVAALGAGLVLAVVGRRRLPLLAVLAPYVVANLASAAAVARAERTDAYVVSAAFATMHGAYGSGFLTGLWRWRRGWRDLVVSRRGFTRARATTDEPARASG